MLKKLSRLLTALILLVAIYTGAYLMLYHTGTGLGMLTHSSPSDPFATNEKHPFVGALFKPAIYLNRHLIEVPRWKRHATGRWIPTAHASANDASTNFIEIRTDGHCTFGLGAHSSEGTLHFDHESLEFFLYFSSTGQNYLLEFRPVSQLSVSPKTAAVDITHSVDQRIFSRTATDPFRENDFSAIFTASAPSP